MFSKTSGVFRFLFAKFLSMLLKLLYITPLLKGFILALDFDLDFGEFGNLLSVSFCNFLDLLLRTGKAILVYM
jgi:hypothetical protein